MIDLEDRVTARLHARVDDITIEPDLDDVLARGGSVAPVGRVSRRVVLGAAAALVAVAVGGLVVIGGANDKTALPFGAPPVDDASVYPVIDPQFLPEDMRGDVVADWGHGDTYEAWTGVVGTVSDGDPHDLIAITVYPPGHQLDLSDTYRGRRDDVLESDGGLSTTLFWTIGDQQLTMVGGDRSTMYEFVDLVEVIDEGPERSGYDWSAELPAGFVELVAPADVSTGAFPRVGTSDGRLNIDIVAEPALVSLASSGIMPTQTVSDPLQGYGASLGDVSFLSLELNDTQSVLISSRTIALDDLITLAEHIRFVDEATWREFYGFVCDGCDGMIEPPVSPPTS